MWYCLLFTVNGTGCEAVMLLVKAALTAAMMSILTSVRFDRVGLGIKVSVFLDRDVKVV